MNFLFGSVFPVLDHVDALSKNVVGVGNVPPQQLKGTLEGLQRVLSCESGQHEQSMYKKHQNPELRTVFRRFHKLPHARISKPEACWRSSRDAKCVYQFDHKLRRTCCSISGYQETRLLPPVPTRDVLPLARGNAWLGTLVFVIDVSQTGCCFSLRRSISLLSRSGYFLKHLQTQDADLKNTPAC